MSTIVCVASVRSSKWQRMRAEVGKWSAVIYQSDSKRTAQFALLAYSQQATSTNHSNVIFLHVNKH